MAWIDTPLLDSICITFFYNSVFDLPQLAQFMGRTPRCQAFNEANLFFDYEGIRIVPFRPTRTDEKTCLRILYKGLDRQLSSVAQVSRSFFPFFNMIDFLGFYSPRYLQWGDDVESIRQLLEIFQPFVAVKSLLVRKKFVRCIALALQDLARERMADVLLSLQRTFFEELMPSRPVRDAMDVFLAARRLIGHRSPCTRFLLPLGRKPLTTFLVLDSSGFTSDSHHLTPEALVTIYFC